MRVPRRTLLVVAALVSCLGGGGAARAQDAGADAATATPHDERVAQVDALVAGTLEVSVEPGTLFEVPLGDEEAIAVDRVRIGTLLRAIDDAADASPKRMPAAIASARADIERLDAAHWQERVALDRARLAFYDLPASRRQALLTEHAERVEAAKPEETEEDRRRREAEEERALVLAAARDARSEAERLVAVETARLIGIEQAVVQVEAAFEADRQLLADRRDAVLVWQRRIRDTESSGPEAADLLYDELRVSLRAARDAQDRALDALTDTRSAVPDLGPDPLRELPPDVSSADAVRRRTEAAGHIERAREAERTLRVQQAATLEAVIDTLNTERLGLLPHLSAAKRGAITGFTAAGLDQARSESRQLLMILRYHRYVGGDWLRTLRQHDGLAGMPYWRVAAVGIPWLIAAFLFGWWRRRGPTALAVLEKRLASEDRSERRTQPSRARRVLSFVRGVRRPLEWLLFFALTVWLFPMGLQALLELQLIGLIVGWTLGGALIVNVINALSSATGPRTHGAHDSDQLRLRSLRLVGRVVVVFALILTISSRLVGEGTIYRWVLSTCWLAALPVFLVLVRWWRETVFERVARVRRKTPLQAWVLANRTGWKSFFAAMVAAVHMFAVGTYKTARNWLSEFDLARRAHAYLFRRELARMATDEKTAEVTPLAAETYASLSPGRQGEAWISSPADRVYSELDARVAAGLGGVVAVVGARGMGRTTLLQRLRHRGGPVAYVDCHRDAIVAPDDLTKLVLLDEVQTLIKPVSGGLVAFDDALTTARARSLTTLWVFAIDEAVWPFLRRARDARPVFDEIFVLESWSDDAIAQLLLRRSAEAGLEPSFEGLLDKLPPAADEVDKQEAVAGKREGYFRMVWDYVRGNPAMALEVWRNSLAMDAAGTTRVRPMQSPAADRLEALPDLSLFVLRAVLQMAPASAHDVALATRLTVAQVENAFRFGQVHGYLAEDDAAGGAAPKVRVTWPWLRAVLRILERRHLLVGS